MGQVDTLDKDFAIGSRVEADFEGVWYVGTLLGLPDDDPKSMGRWKVQCDADPADTITYVLQVRAIPAPDAHLAADDILNSDHDTLDEVRVGSRVEEFFADMWCPATVVGLP